jgi:hypothetical protein
MVPRESAICSMSDVNNQTAVRSDHPKIVKFKSRTEDHYQRVFAKIQETLRDYEGHSLQKDPSSITVISPYRSEGYFMVPFPKNEDYVGRSPIREFMAKRGKDPRCSHTTVAICGLGGIG